MVVVARKSMGDMNLPTFALYWFSLRLYCDMFNVAVPLICIKEQQPISDLNFVV